MEEADKEETGSSKMPSDDEIKEATMELLKGGHRSVSRRALGLLSAGLASPYMHEAEPACWHAAALRQPGLGGRLNRAPYSSRPVCNRHRPTRVCCLVPQSRTSTPRR